MIEFVLQRSFSRTLFELDQEGPDWDQDLRGSWSLTILFQLSDFSTNIATYKTFRLVFFRMRPSLRVALLLKKVWVI